MHAEGRFHAKTGWSVMTQRINHSWNERKKRRPSDRWAHDKTATGSFFRTYDSAQQPNRKNLDSIHIVLESLAHFFFVRLAVDTSFFRLRQWLVIIGAHKIAKVSVFQWTHICSFLFISFFEFHNVRQFHCQYGKLKAIKQS